MGPDPFWRALSRCDLPPGFGWGVSGHADPGILSAIEARAVARAIPSRQAEFAGGRAAARRAMAMIGATEVPVPMGPDRAPRWPDGLIGSISHDAGLCVAAVARRGWVRSVGLDIAPDAPLALDIEPEITRPDEAQVGDPTTGLRLRFGAKEAVFKAQYPLTGLLFGFQAVHVDLGNGAATFPQHHETASLPAWLRARPLMVRQWPVAGFVLSLCVIGA